MQDKQQAPQVIWSERRGHVVAMELDDGRIGWVCTLNKRHTKQHATRLTAAQSAEEHRNNICELADLLPDEGGSWR